MTIFEHTPAQEEILDFINDMVRQLQAAGTPPKYIIVGTAAYEALRQAMAQRFKRTPGSFETYNYLPIVVDPFRSQEVCVVPAPGACADGVRAYRVGDGASP
jgi:hypothetical protein